MDRSEIVNHIARSLSEVLEREISDVSEHVRLVEDLGLDSSSVMELLMALEDNTAVEIDAANLEIEDFRTVGTLADYVVHSAGVAAAS